MRILNSIKLFSLTNLIRIILGITVILTFLSFIFLNQEMDYIREDLYQSSELKVLTQIIIKNVSEGVSNGDKAALEDLRKNIQEFSMHLDILLNGKKDSQGKIIVPPNDMVVNSPSMKNLIAIWKVIEEESNTILDNESYIVNIYKLFDQYSSILDKLADAYYSLFIKARDIEHIPKEAENAFMQQQYNISQILIELRTILSMYQPLTQEKIQLFTNYIESLEKNNALIQSSLTPGADATLYTEINNNLKYLLDNKNNIIDTARVVTEVYFGAREKILNMSTPFLNATTDLEEQYSMAKGHYVKPGLAYGLSGLSILLLLLLFYVTRRQNLKELKESEEENTLLQRDIRELVEEIEDLATGNLTVKATPTALGITSDIAEAINFALNALRKLVITINKTTKRIHSATKEVSKVAVDLALLSERQTDEIEQATDSVNTLASSIDLVSSNAKESAHVAENSVNIAKDGVLVVQNTMAGMERIREQIQETEKRIRRLGESSQEIGEIVSLIDGIAEQTNILSLNASIQAAMAGEAGKGFAVVADEVQRLAEKSGKATKEVETLVKTIQTDTVRAVTSMEKAITEVVSGTKLATDAGHALEKIEKVSETLSNLIQHISSAAEEQARVASRITKMMSVIEDITEQTGQGSSTTKESIDALVNLADELQRSVAGFKISKVDHGTE